MSIRFNSAGQTLSTAASAPGATSTTLCWVRLAVDRGAFQTVWSADQAGGATYFELATDSDSTRLRVFNGDLTGGGVTGPTLTVGTWYRTAVVVSAGTVTLWISEAGGTLTSYTATGFTAPTSPILTLGDSGFGGDWLNGAIANFKQYSAALTQTEVEAELARYTPVRTSGLVRWVPFHTPAGYDLSGNGNDFTGGSGTVAEDGPPIVGARAAVDLTSVGTSAWVAPATSTSIAPTYPSGLVENDVVYIVIHSKPDTATPSTPSGWGLVGSLTGGSGTQGAGTGATRMTVFSRVVPSGGLSGSQTVTITGGSSPVAHMRAYRAPAGLDTTYEAQLGTWSVTTASTTIGGTTAAIEVGAKDAVVLVAGTTDDQSTTLAVTGVTATGMTFGALTQDPSGTVINAQGNDISAVAYRGVITAGAASAVTVTVTATSSSSETAMGAVLRVRGSSEIPITTATKFYLNNTTAPYAPLASLSGWTDNSIATTPSRLGRTAAGVAFSSSSTETSATAVTALLRQFVSGPASSVGYLSGTYSLTIGRLESNAAADMFLQVGVWVSVGDSAAVRGSFSFTGVEFPTTAAAATVTGTAGYIAYQPGDRIVVEVGYSATNVSATSYTGTIYFGGTGTDLADGSTDMSAPATMSLPLTAATFEDTSTSYDGAVAVAGSATVSAGALLVRAAASTIAGAAAVTAAATRAVVGAVSIGGAAAVTAAGAPVQAGAVTIAGVAATSAVAVRTAAGAGVAVSGAAAVSTAGVTERPAAVSISGAGAVSAASVRTLLAGSAISGSATTAVSSAAVLPAASSITGSVSTSAAATLVLPAVSVIAGAATVSAAADQTRAAGIAIAGAGAVTAAAVVTRAAVVAVAGSGTVTAGGGRTAVSASAVAASAVVTASAVATSVASTSIVGAASTSVATTGGTAGAVAVTAAAVVSINPGPNYPDPGDYDGGGFPGDVGGVVVTKVAASAIAGAGTVTTAGVATRPAAVAITGDAATSAVAARGIPAASSVAGLGAVTAGAGVSRVGAVTIAGSGAVVAAAVRSVSAAVAVSGVAVVVASSDGSVAASASITGTGLVTAAAVAVRAAASSIAGVAAVAAGATASGSGAVQIGGAGAVTTTGVVSRAAQVTIVGAASSSSGSTPGQPGGGGIGGTGGITVSATLQVAASVAVAASGSVGVAGAVPVGGAVSIGAVGAVSVQSRQVFAATVSVAAAASVVAASQTSLTGVVSMSAVGLVFAAAVIGPITPPLGRLHAGAPEFGCRLRGGLPQTCGAVS